MRPIPGTDPEHLLNEIKTRINRLNIESSWEMTVNNMVPGMDTGENTEFQQQLTPYARSKQASAAAYTSLHHRWCSFAAYGHESFDFWSW
jgi:hypothetical protein